VKQIAADCAVTRQAIHKWLRGDYDPSAEHFQTLSEMTDGAVTYERWTQWRKQKPSEDPRMRMAVRS